MELGGFPGFYSVYLLKRFGISPTIVDIFIDEEILNKFLKLNKVKPGSIELIEADVFAYQPERKYDLVFSFGLVEHFENIELIMEAHKKFLARGGRILITIPNFKHTLIGWFHKKFDKKTYSAHNTIFCYWLSPL